MFLEVKGYGEILFVIYGFLIGKLYLSFVVSLCFLDFLNLVNWNIWVVKGREINWDFVSSGEWEWIGVLKKNKDEVLFFSKVFIFFLLGFIFFFWMMEKLVSYGLKVYFFFFWRKGFFYRWRCWVRGVEFEEWSELC